VGPWYAEPNLHPNYQKKTLSDEQMAAIEAGPQIANAKDRVGDGDAYYKMCRKLGVWPMKVASCDPLKEPTRFVPFMAAHHVTPDYPPTLLIHGTEDTDVPFEQSKIMARELAKHGVPHRLIPIPGGEHGFKGGKPEDIAAANAAVLPFVDKYMKAQSAQSQP